MLRVFFYVFGNIKAVSIGIVACLFLLSGCFSDFDNSPYDSSKWSKYNSGDLAKDLREKRARARANMVYPKDNDDEYSLPKRPIYLVPKPGSPAPASVYNFDVNAPRYPSVQANPVPQQQQQPVKIKPAPVKPAPARPTPQPTAPVYNQQPIYEDADENYETGYPKYDPEEDNSGYYYQNMNKPLPKPVDDGSGNYNYPIYFD